MNVDNSHGHQTASAGRGAMNEEDLYVKCRTSAIYGLWGFMGIRIDSIDFL